MPTDERGTIRQGCRSGPMLRQAPRRQPQHCGKLAAAQEAKRMTAWGPVQIAPVPNRGASAKRTEKIGVCREVIGRELKAFGISTAPVTRAASVLSRWFWLSDRL